MQIAGRDSLDDPGLSYKDAYKALLRLSILFDAETKLENLFDLIGREAAKLLKAERVYLFLLDFESKELYSTFLPESEKRQIRLPLGRGIAGTVAFTGQSLCSNDVQSDLHYYDDHFGPSACNMLTAPMRTHYGRVLGVLQLVNKKGGAFDEQDREILETLGDLAAIALDRTNRLLEQHKLSTQLIYQAHHDTLTGLPNRLRLEENLQHALEEAKRSQHQVAVLFIDLDRFKLINDSLGHSFGDALLKQVAHRLQNHLRHGDIVARQGGDEFVVVLKVIRNLQSVNKMALNLLQALREPFYVEGQELYISASIGISLYPSHAETVSEMLRYADNAMYQAKDQGKNNFQFFSQDMSETEQRNLWLVTQLHKALEYGELLLFYQPQIELGSGKITGVEALIRWDHRELGLVSPGEFIPLAEETGLIVPVGTWVMEESCRQAKAWQLQGYPPMRMAVNVSAMQFNRDNFVEIVVQSLEKSGLEPCWLELELTEGLLLSDTQATISKLKKLKELGVFVAIDDFGTGYSSLRYLQQMPIDLLKIDQSFVRWLGSDAEEDAKARALLKTIAMLGQNLGMKIIAEGVETLEQLNYLRGIGCEEVQGYLFSEPKSVPDLEVFLNESISKKRIKEGVLVTLS